MWRLINNCYIKSEKAQGNSSLLKMHKQVKHFGMSTRNKDTVARSLHHEEAVSHSYFRKSNKNFGECFEVNWFHVKNKLRFQFRKKTTTTTTSPTKILKMNKNKNWKVFQTLTFESKLEREIKGFEQVVERTKCVRR